MKNVCLDTTGREKGSVLILVLWVLIVISFLSSSYVAHNREKTDIALNASERFKRETAAFSILELFASSQYDLIKSKATEENSDKEPSVLDKNDKNDINSTASSMSEAQWIKFMPGGVEVWVKIEEESSRTEITLENDNSIRTTITSIYGKDREKEAEIFADSLMDWIDGDDLVRVNGAEKEYYNNSYPPCDPANGPLKSMSQLFMVRGFNEALFWGDPYEYVIQLPIFSSDDSENSKKRTSSGNRKEEDMEQPLNSGLMDILTVYSKDYTRVSMLFPADGDKWYNEIFWLGKNGSSYNVVEQLSRTMIIPSVGY